MGIVAVCIFIAALAQVWYTYYDVSDVLKHQLQEQGISISTGLTAQSRDAILTDNQFALYRLLKETRDANKDIAYIFILDATGNVLVHTFDGGFPTELLGKNMASSGELYHIQRLSTENERIQDIVVPIIGGKVGSLRLGMSEAAIEAAVVGQVRTILLWALLILLLGLSVAYGLASILTDPVTQLAEATRAVGRGDFKWESPVWAKDEIGKLGAAFNQMSEELKHKEKMREQLLAKVISAQEEERKRIARELHDETGQALTSLMVGMRFVEELASADKVKGKVTELRALAAQTLEEVHRLATELRPSVLDDLGLHVAIKRYIEQYSSKFGIKVDSHISDISGQRLVSETEVTIYRIIQEALTNIARYASANNVSVVLRYRDLSLVAVIEDDGKGFDIKRVMASRDGKRLGLFGMYERASLIGGNLTIESQPGAGTTIFLEVPLKLSQEALHEQDKITSG
jgi:signal transduction histidine kinase